MSRFPSFRPRFLPSTSLKSPVLEEHFRFVKKRFGLVTDNLHEALAARGFSTIRARPVFERYAAGLGLDRLLAPRAARKIRADLTAKLAESYRVFLRKRGKR